MSNTTLKQGQQLLNLVAQSDIKRDEFQILLESGRFTALLQEFTVESAHDEPQHPEPQHPEPTITLIKVPLDYSRTLIAMRDATKCDGYVSPDLNDEHFPVEARECGERELVLVCFHRPIKDDEDPAKSELLRELGKLGLKPEGPPELCAIGEHHPELQREFPIVARRQVWRHPDGNLVCPLLGGSDRRRSLRLLDVHDRWHDNVWFLASRK